MSAKEMRSQHKTLKGNSRVDDTYPPGFEGREVGGIKGEVRLVANPPLGPPFNK